jgi:dihydropteroate synthase
MTINCRGRLIDLKIPKVMGILNFTPDSFYDGGKYKSELAVLKQVEKMLVEGATFIDLGAYSSRPGADDISEAEELKRIVPITKAILQSFPNVILSIDSFRSNVIKACIDCGAALANDISGGQLDPQMMPTVADLGIPYIIMHMKGTPQTMKNFCDYENLIEEVVYYFSERMVLAKSHGIKDIILDPGFGFSKNTKQNFELLNHLDFLNNLDQPILMGASRKSMIYKTLNTSADRALNGTTVINSIGLMKGANILRVHDVKEAIEAVNLYTKMCI